MTKLLRAFPLALLLSLSLWLGVSAQSRVLVAGTRTVGTTAVSMATGPCSEVIIQNDALSGTGSLAVGDATSQTVKLAVGNSLVLAIDDLSTVYVKAVNTTGTQVVNYLCRKN